MSRNLVYVNGQNETVTFETGPYLIVKIEGLGIPNVDRQEQKAPYQDGTTYIDSLLQNRDIVVELAITKPNDFANIALYRRELSQRLCPKYGLGTLTYTDEDNNSYNIRAVVSSMVFPNKDYRDPYMRAMVTFTACDPYWKDVTTDSINLPTSVTSGETVINNTVSNYPSTVQLPNGNILIVYVRAPGTYLVSRLYTTSWSSETVINSAVSAYPNLIQKSNGDLIVCYRRGSDGYLVMRTYTSSWSSESVINAADTYDSSLIERADGSLFVAYYRTGDLFLVSRTYTTSWSAESVINAAVSADPCVIELSNGNLYIVYYNSSQIKSRLFTSSWQPEEIINTFDSRYPSLIKKSDGSLYIAYRVVSTGYLESKIYKTTWVENGTILAADSEKPCVIELADKSILISYQRVADTYIVSVTRSVTPVPAVITGDVPAPFVVTFNGPSVNPRIINQNTLEYIRLNTTLAASDSFEVDTTFGNKTVKLTQGGIVKNGIAFLDIGSTFFSIQRPTLPSLPLGVNPYKGLKAYWNMDSVPEIPDDPAGVTYLQDAWETVDGWVSVAGYSTVSATNGLLRSVVNSGQSNNRVQKNFAYGTLKTYRLKVRSSKAGSVVVRVTRGGTGDQTIATKTVVANEWTIFDAYEPLDVTQLYVQQSVLVPGDVLEVDWVYVGTGAYLPNSLIDNSGNGNHGTVFGATPVEGISGKALAFDGVKAYCAIPNQTLPSIFSISAWVKSNGQTAAVQEIFSKYTAYATGRLGIRRDTNSDALQIATSNGTGAVTNNVSGVFTGNAQFHLGAVVDFIGKTILIYKNGVLLSTISISTSVELSISESIYLGTTATTQFFNGTIDEPRIYNRALSAEEVKYLYDNPGVALPADATVIYFEDDSVASTATATLEFAERYSGL